MYLIISLIWIFGFPFFFFNEHSHRGQNPLQLWLKAASLTTSGTEDLIIHIQAQMQKCNHTSVLFWNTQEKLKKSGQTFKELCTATSSQVFRISGTQIFILSGTQRVPKYWACCLCPLQKGPGDHCLRVLCHEEAEHWHRIPLPSSVWMCWTSVTHSRFCSQVWFCLGFFLKKLSVYV